MPKSLVISILAWFTLYGCNSPLPSDTSASAFGEILTEHRPLKADRPTGKLGEDCTQHGASGCLSGICLHTEPGPKKGYVCSQRCTTASECPAHWTCGPIHPASPQLLCIPPAGRKPVPSSP